MSQCTEQSVRVQTALASINLIQASPVLHISTLFPYTTLFRSPGRRGSRRMGSPPGARRPRRSVPAFRRRRSEEHTSELQSRVDLVCRLLLEKKNVSKPVWQQLSTFKLLLLEL